MAEGSFDPLFTMDVVRDFMVANGGKVSNHTLVTHFKSFLNDSQRKNANRLMFKQYVNTLAVVKLDVSGEKVLVLKKKFRDSGSFRGEPAAAKSLPSDQDRVKAKRAKTDDIETVEPTDVPVQLTSDIQGLNDDKENLRKTSTGNLPDLSAGVADNKRDEELEMSTDEQLEENDINNMRCCVPDDLGQLSDNVDIERGADITQLDTSSSTEISALENVDDGYGAARNADKNRADVVDLEPAAPAAAGSSVDDMFKQEPPAAESNVSVREMAKQLNNADSPANLTPRVHTTPHASGKAKRERESRRHDDGGYEFSLSESEREWTIKSAYSDYQAMAKLLLTNPSLAGRRDFLSGYTALHWAAKSGAEDVVKLLFGSKEPPNVNARSHGGYTPLHVATIHGHDSVVRLLVEVYGANPNIRDYAGRKPKHYFAHSAVSARVQQLLQPPPPGSAQRSGSNKHGHSVHLGSFTGSHSERTSPSPGSSPGPSSRKGSVNSDSGLMPPPRELPAVVRRRPVGSNSSVDSAVDRDSHCHSDSEMHRAGSDTELHGGSGSTPNFSAFV